MKKLLFIAAMLLCQILAAQEFGIVNISVCNLRATPDYDAEMVSQALLGTPVHILEISPSYCFNTSYLSTGGRDPSQTSEGSLPISRTSFPPANTSSR